MLDFQTLANLAMSRLEELGNISQSADYLDRRYLSPEHQQANQLVGGWMQDAGMSTWQDAAGNLWGRFAAPEPDAPRFILGSHLDTVPNGGKYDGMLGVVAPVTLIGALHESGIKLPFHLDVVGFGDEEGTRFRSTLLGSRALTGKWPQSWADLEDENGITLRQAMAQFGLEFDQVLQAKLPTGNIKGYLELHIEQGPVLEQQNLPVGVVSAIAGAKRFEFIITGMAGHAGTVPMTLRQDALAATSEMILAIESCAKRHDVVATVGQISNRPNGVNVISGLTTFSLDIRSELDERREAALEDILQQLNAIAERRNVRLDRIETHAANAVQCDPALQALLRQAIATQNIAPYTLFSGAGHDAMAIAEICPIAMLFLRCDKGISHHPAESIHTQDVATALAVLSHTLQHFT
ncbi:allantoate amidohydrolase [Maribrevibacterium harenarium]|uniref:Allantoate amidohydrolase n=1 Tax=Maribrevibacterium harenarium TaxID=2589817 RepID=A0A501X192_9GAMM|nr:allantoate amidohydrolase [Maribrevibacterium harenarium]TPE53376.1 allantoate amidohydrolase [Maribrevibacterium harenarium]